MTRLLRVEGLESRELLTTLTVINTLDAGPGSLRQAILDANASPDGGVIRFSIPPTDANFIDADSAMPGGDVQPDVWRIQPLTELPEINHPTAGILIDGRTQAEFTADLNPLGPEIVLDGNGVFARGLVITSSGHTIAGLNIQRFGRSGIDIVGGDRNVIIGNYLGTDATGTAPAGNQRYGIALENGAAKNRIGTNGDGIDDAKERNVISGNLLSGLALTELGTDENIVAGNYVGTNATGTAALGNANRGIAIFNGARNNRVGTNGDGTNDSAEANTISGNAWEGVGIDGLGTSNNVVAGNLIGTDATGKLDLGNTLSGISIFSSASLNIIGGGAALRNLISGNDSSGIFITSSAAQNLVAGNFIGTDMSGKLAIPNTGSGVRLTNGANQNVVGTNSDGVSDDQEGNLIAGNAQYGVLLTDEGTVSNIVAGNLVGTDVSGVIALGNGLRGVAVENGAGFSVIGGTSSAARNIISGNGAGGIRISGTAAGATNIVVMGNYIGTDVTGSLAIANNGFGILMEPGTSGNRIGTDGDGQADAAEGNLISGNNNSGIRMVGAGTTSNVVAGNLIGTNALGNAALANNGHGVSIGQGATNNRIGTRGDGSADAAERNVISGNANRGVLLSDDGTSNNVVAGNYIGVNALATAPLANMFDGVLIQMGAKSNRIGTDGNGMGDDAERNIIGGNGSAGVNIITAGTAENVVAGNSIGTNATGSLDLGNMNDGVRLQTSAQNNRIGGLPPFGNRIAFNRRNGVSLFTTASTGNSILGNAIYSNVLLGIDLGNDGATPNDAGDLDVGPNNLQNSPVLSRALLIGKTLTIEYSTNAALDAGYPLRVELFKADVNNQEGALLMAAASVAAVDQGIRQLSFLKPEVVLAGDTVVATVTDAAGNTSEFSLPSVTITSIVNPWHNSDEPLDVSGDKHIAAGDALEVINYLNAFHSGSVPTTATHQAPYCDTNDDGQVSPVDALDVINAINAGLANAEGEGVVDRDRLFTNLRGDSDLWTLLAYNSMRSKPRRSG